MLKIRCGIRRILQPKLDLLLVPLSVDHHEGNELVQQAPKKLGITVIYRHINLLMDERISFVLDLFEPSFKQTVTILFITNDGFRPRNDVFHRFITKEAKRLYGPPVIKKCLPAIRLSRSILEVPERVDNLFLYGIGGVQIRMKSEAVRFLSALCPKTTASTAV